jgi:ribosomal protein S18 acetylase RimI-like enzyme
MIQIKEVQTKAELKKFIDFPWMHYRLDSNWVPPLKMSVKALFDSKHPFYKTSDMRSWLAYDEKNKIVGRISAIYNRAYNEFQGANAGFFGFFESIDSIEVANALFSTAEKYLKEKGAKELIGPMSPSTNYECGILVEGFESPAYLMMTHNPAYYDKLISNYGLTKSKDLLAFLVDTNTQLPERMLAAAAHNEKKANITYRKINVKNWNAEIELMHKIYNSAWVKNWGFVPMNKEEFFHAAKDLKSIVDDNLITFVSVGAETVGFVVTLPDYNQVFKQIPDGKLLPFGIFKLLNAKKYISQVRVITLGIDPRFQNLGLGSLLYKQAQVEVTKNPRYKKAEMSWVLEDNDSMTRPLYAMGAVVHKRYRVYNKNL